MWIGAKNSISKHIYFTVKSVFICSWLHSIQRKADMENSASTFQILKKTYADLLWIKGPGLKTAPKKPHLRVSKLPLFWEFWAEQCQHTEALD